MTHISSETIIEANRIRDIKILNENERRRVHEIEVRVEDEIPNEEIDLSMALLYFLAQVDHSIMLTTDKRHIADKSWNNVKRHLNQGGKVVQTMRALREHLESEKMKVAHFKEIK